MTWGLIFTVIFYLAGVAAVWCSTGISWFKESPTGRKSRPLLAVFWPFVIVALVFMVAISVIDLAYQSRANITFGPERGE